VEKNRGRRGEQTGGEGVWVMVPHLLVSLSDDESRRHSAGDFTPMGGTKNELREGKTELG